jgi:predicted signal transduction protein with EAL and GGDEF domain
MVIAVSIIIVFLIGVIDYFVLWELYIFIFYLLPVFLATWYAGRMTGVLISFISSVAWLAADILSFHSYTHPIIPYWNIAVIFGFFMLITCILSALKKALDHEKDLARTDYLTGVANRRLFFELAEVELNKAHRYLRPITLAYIDLDNFKPINDQITFIKPPDSVDIMVQKADELMLEAKQNQKDQVKYKIEK